MRDFRTTKYVSYEYSNRPYYLMPYDIIKDEYKYQNGEVEYYGKYFKSDTGIYIYSRAFVNALLRLTELSEESYYRKYVANLPDEYIVKCKYCGKPKSFISISKGYSGGIGNGYTFDPDSLFCNSSCQLNYRYLDPNFKDEVIDRLNSVKSQSHGRFTQWMNLGKWDDLCYFYIALTTKGYKFGVSSKDDRSSWHGEFITINRILSDTRYNVGCLERDLKLYLDINNEYFQDSQLNLIEEFIKNYKFN